MKIIETCKIEWISEGGKSTPLSEMHDDHLLRAAAWCQARLDMTKGILDKLHPSLHETALSHNGRRLQEWVEILLETANARAEKKASDGRETRRALLERELAALEPPEEKIARLRAELESLN
jgi:hypothetical protein